jgi:hypothetical protein
MNASHPMQRIRPFATLILITAVSLGVGCKDNDKAAAEKKQPELKTMAAGPAKAAQPGDAATHAFRDAVELPPAGWTGNVFKLSHAYPAEKPAPPAGGYPWEKIDFTTQPGEYMDAVLKHARADLEAVDWDPTKLAKPNWFHAPWMAEGDPSGNGREFIHGMTKERGSRAGELSPGQKTPYIGNYAVGFYNDLGGWTFGRVWGDPGNPNTSDGRPVFENGTMAIKLLFTAADPAKPDDGAPYLKDSKEWQANVALTRNGPRQPETLRLLQVDIAVRDKRNDDVTGWLLGTFVYNGNKPGATPLDRLTPVGLMWGDSPGVKPGGPAPSQQWINPDVGVYQHLGWAKRLNGPVDNPISSCMSCHGAGAETPVLSPMLPTDPPPPAPPLTDDERLKWFINVKAGVAKDAAAVSLDYSLQMSAAIQNWKAWATPMAVKASGAVVEHPVHRGEDHRSH